MEKAEINALLMAHGGRAQTVASLHVLRAPALEAADHAFLAGHAGALATVDLQRWLGLAAGAQRPAVLDALAGFAEKDPARFEFEIARAPHFGLEKPEVAQLVARLEGRVPKTLLAALSPRPTSSAPVAAPGAADTDGLSLSAASIADGAPLDGFFDPGEILGEIGFGADTGAPSGEGLGDLLGDGDFFADDGGGFGSKSPTLDALLADLPAAKGPRARAAWKKRAIAAAHDTAEDWSPVVTRLPRELRDAVLLRAESSPRPEERAAMLEWLFQNGGKRAELVRLTLGLLKLGQQAQNVRPWLAESWIPKALADKSGWSRHGAPLLATLIEQYAFSELDELFTATMTGGGALGPGLLALPNLQAGAQATSAAVIAAFSKTLVELTSSAVKKGERKAALAGAAALACLGVRPGDLPVVRALRRKRGARGEVATVLALAEKNVRRAKTPAKLEDLVATVHVLSDAMS